MEINLSTDYDSFYSWLVNWTMGEHQQRTWQALGRQSEEGDFIVNKAKASPGLITIPIQVNRSGAFREEAVLLKDFKEENGQITFMAEFLDDLYDLITQMRTEAKKYFLQRKKGISSESNSKISGQVSEVEEIKQKKQKRSEGRTRRIHIFLKLYYQDTTLTQTALADKATEFALNEIKKEIRKNNTNRNDDQIETEVALQFSELYRKPQFAKTDVLYDFRDLGITWGLYREVLNDF